MSFGDGEAWKESHMLNINGPGWLILIAMIALLGILALQVSLNPPGFFNGPPFGGP